MGLGKKLSDNMTEYGTLAIVIVIVSVILLKFRDVSGVTSGLNETIDTFISAFSEPQNWIVIIIIAIIGFALLKLFQMKKK